MSELKKNSNPKKQAGYSKTKECDFISLVILVANYGDGEFQSHNIKTTYLIEENNDILDVNDNKNVNDEVGFLIIAAYHPLPDGKFIEFNFENTSYDKELENMYETVKKVRLYYDFDNKLPTKLSENSTRTNLKI